MYPFFQGDMSDVSLPFPLIRPRKVVQSGCIDYVYKYIHVIYTASIHAYSSCLIKYVATYT